MPTTPVSARPRPPARCRAAALLCACWAATAPAAPQETFRHPDPPREGEARFFPVAEGGEARCVLVCAAEVRQTAEALRGYLQRVTGAPLRLLADGAPLPEALAVIHVGETAASAGVPLDLPELRYGPDLFPNLDGYRIRTPDAHTLTIRALTPRAVAHGVVGFLRRYAGVRQYWEGAPGSLGEVVPSRPTLWIPEVDWSDWPFFYSRWISQRPFTPGRGPLDFFRRSNLLPCGENYSRLLPPARHRDPHPEYFAEINGRRLAPADGQDSAWQPCLSNPEVADIMAGAVLDAFRRNPGLPGHNVSLNDGGRDCGCAACRAWDTPDAPYARRMSDRYVRFTNLVCERVAREFPDKHIVFLAYGMTRHPPLTVAPHPRLLPVLTVGNAFQDWDAWMAAGPAHMGLYLHHNDGLYFLLPRMDVRQAARRIRYIASTGRARVFYLEAYPHWPLSGLVPYVTSELLWDPRQDLDALLDEFYTVFFGPAAAPMRTFYEALIDGYEGWLAQRGIPHPTGRDLTSVTDGRSFRQFEALPAEGALRAGAALRDAAALAAADPLPARRVEAVQRLFGLVGPAVESFWRCEALRSATVTSESGALAVTDSAQRLFELARIQSNHIARVLDATPADLHGAVFSQPGNPRPIALHEALRSGQPLPEALAAIRCGTETVSAWLRTTGGAERAARWWDPVIASAAPPELKPLFTLARLHGAAPPPVVFHRTGFDALGRGLAPADLDLMAGVQEIVLDSQLPQGARTNNYLGHGRLGAAGFSVYAWHPDRTPFTLALTRQDTPEHTFALTLRHIQRARLGCHAPIPPEAGRLFRVAFRFRRTAAPGRYSAEVLCSRPGRSHTRVATLLLPETPDAWHDIAANIETPDDARGLFLHLFAEGQAEEAACWVHDVSLAAFPEP